MPVVIVVNCPVACALDPDFLDGEQIHSPISLS